MKVGMIGLGTMGRNVALNIRRAGFAMTVHDIRPDAAASLGKKGAAVAGNPAEVLDRSDVVVTMVFGPKEIDAVVRGANGLLAGLLPRQKLDRSHDQQPEAHARACGGLQGAGRPHGVGAGHRFGRFGDPG